MDENVEPTVDSGNDFVTPVNKKKTRRGNKGRPKQQTSEVNGDPIESLTDAARKLAISQKELIETALGVTVHPPASSTSSADAKKPRKKKPVAEVLLEQSLAREKAALQDKPEGSLDAGQSVSEEAPAEKGKSKKKTVLKEKVVVAEPSQESPPKDKKKKEVVKENTDTQPSHQEEKVPREKKKKAVKEKVVSEGQDVAKAKEPSEEGEQAEAGASPEKPAKEKSRSKKKAKTVVTAETSAEGQQADATQSQGADQTAEKSPEKAKSKSRSKAKRGEKAGESSEVGATGEDKPAKPRSRKKKPKPAAAEGDGPAPGSPKKEGAREGPVTPGSGRRNQRRSRGSDGMDRPEDNKFPDHWSLEQVEKGVADGSVVKSVVRINKKNYREAYVNSPDGGMDILLEGVRARNRSLEGDEVAVLVLPQDQWKRSNNKVQRTGQVVCLLRKEHHRQAVGSLKPLPDANSLWALFSPRDNRMPRIRVLAATCPPNFASMSDMLYLAEMKEWNDMRFAVGVLLEIVGMSGNIEAETKTILMDNGLDTTPYEPEMSKYFPSLPYTIPKAELAKREDFRDLCIFTIDPATARDLDDAVSYRELPDGQGAEVGVHISDVSFFLSENTELDAKVCSRATTTYLIQSVFHMLPLELCRLCSLTPGEDKLAFSVLWRVTPAGEFLEPRFTRSVILSACQMSYEQAQTIMDAPADKEWTPEELPEIHGKFTAADVVATVRGLRPLALGLRALRFEGGALRIDQPKLCFGIDPASGLPDKFFVYENQECHRLIEELMLLANTAVARQLHTHQPDIALLRCHPEPHDHMLPELQTMLRRCGVELDISSSGAMHTSLQKYLGSEDPAERARGWALSALLSKPMARARYFCAKGTDKDEQWHYALSVPLYTHFTSPIRRYADVMVHRLLAATLDYTPTPDWHPDYVSKVASNCNGKKYSAKRAGEQSGELYLTLYVGMHGPLKEEAVVIDVKDHSFDVLVLRTGSTHRVYTNCLVGRVAKAEHKQVFRNVWEAHVTWREPAVGLQLIKHFSLVTVELRKADRELRIDAKICPPVFNK